jgi:glucan phosphoethanolaminetransferase (alkaline phosphatase superfamily)
MKGASLLLVLLFAKLAMAWGHASSLTGWSLVVYTWQDVLVALAFAGLDHGLRKRIGVTPRISWGLYWVLAIYAAINVPVARALSTPLTWPMIRSARGPLADSILLYVTPTNCLVIALILLSAAVLPHLLRRVPQPRAKAWTTCAAIFVLLGLIARTRADTRGMDRNAVTALIDTGLPRVTANADASDWRALRFTAQDGLRDVDGGAHENLSWLEGSARGRNVVMVGLESTAAQYLSLYGGQYQVMPNLNALAEKGIVFANAYSVYPESIKGLFSVLCSEFPAFDTEPEQYGKVHCNSLAEVLAGAGYRTAMFHSGRFGYLGMESVIRNRGYQTLEDAGEIGGNYKSSFGVDEPATVARMLAWIDALPDGQRFFLTYLPIAGHHPYATPDGRGPFVGPDEITQYRNALHYGDVSLGTLTDGLCTRGLDANTVWVIYGDHGEAFGQHAGNYGHTFFLYDENIHVPFLIVAPGLIRRQERVSKVVSLVDTAPTVLDLLGISSPANYQGRTMLDGVPRTALFFADYSLGFLGLRDGPWKFVYEIESGKEQLFKMDQDPRELSNLAPSESARASWYGQVVRGWSGEQKSLIERSAVR